MLKFLTAYQKSPNNNKKSPGLSFVQAIFYSQQYYIGEALRKTTHVAWEANLRVTIIQYYTERHDTIGLHEEMLAFGIMLRRAKRILSRAEVQEVTEKMLYYDPLIAEDPVFGKMIEDARREALLEGKAEGKAEDLAVSKEILLRFVQEQYPVLTGETLQQAVLPDSRSELDRLLINVAIAPNENEVRLLLHLPPA